LNCSIFRSHEIFPTLIASHHEIPPGRKEKEKNNLKNKQEII